MSTCQLSANIVSVCPTHTQTVRCKTVSAGQRGVCVCVCSPMGALMEPHICALPPPPPLKVAADQV